MAREVANVFKIILGTIVALFLLMVITEVINLSVYSTQLQQMTKMSANKAMTMYCQESYKVRSDSASSGQNSGTTKVSDVVNCDGGKYVDGNFYGSSAQSTIYNNMYTNSPEFKSWLKKYAPQGNWFIGNVLDYKLNGGSSTSLAKTSSTAEGQQLINYMGQYYMNNYVTPVNYGIPYMGYSVNGNYNDNQALGVLNRIFKWNLASILSNCDSDLIRRVEDANGNKTSEYAVFYKGFYIRADKATLDVHYDIYDLDNTSDRNKFESLTHIDTDNLGFDSDLANIATTDDVEDDERRRVCVVTGVYNIPISYKGITALSRMMTWIWNQSVEGLHGGATPVGEVFDSITTDTMTNDAAESVGALTVPGTLIYYIVR